MVKILILKFHPAHLVDIYFIYIPWAAENHDCTVYFFLNLLQFQLHSLGSCGRNTPVGVRVQPHRDSLREGSPPFTHSVKKQKNTHEKQKTVSPVTQNVYGGGVFRVELDGSLRGKGKKKKISVQMLNMTLRFWSHDFHLKILSPLDDP